MNLMEYINNGVYETNLTRKLTLEGSTKAYKVYKIDPTLLFYNDNNDRIATWINEYNSTNQGKLSDLPLDEYNAVIEKFVYDSNPAALEKTKRSIEITDQREAGVVLLDGRIIDGNRRFTCVRMINKSILDEKRLFEAVILPYSLENNYKKIKLLELSIQHGEEQKVEYNSIDKLLGMYFDIAVNKYISIEEYSASTNEPINDIKKHLVVASFVEDYLSFIHASKKYYLARDMQIVSPLTDLADFLKRIRDVDTQMQIKEIVFASIFLNATGDFRKYIKDLSMILTSGAMTMFLNEQTRLKDTLVDELGTIAFNNINEIKSFVNNHSQLAEDIINGFDFWLNKSRKKTVLAKPIVSTVRATENIDSIDAKVIMMMDEENKQKLARQLHQLINASNKYLDIVEPKKEEVAVDIEVNSSAVVMSNPEVDEPIFNVDNSTIIRGLIVPVHIKALYNGKPYSYKLLFRNKDNEIISEIIGVDIEDDFDSQIVFNLSKSPSAKDIIYLQAIRKDNDDKKISASFSFRCDINFESDLAF